MCQWSIWVQCLSKMAEWQTLPHIELTKDKSSSPLVSKIVRWVTWKTGSPIYIRQIRVPKPAQPTIRPFPRFVLNLVSCVKKSDANLLRPRYVASRPSIRTHYPPFFLFYKLSNYLLLNCSALSSYSHSNLVVIHYHPAPTFSDHTGPESYQRGHGELFGSGRAEWT